MQPFQFKIEAPAGEAEAGIPIAVAGQVMVDIQRLLTDIGESMLRADLKIQNGVPAELLRKFELRTGGSGAGSVSSVATEGNAASLFDSAAKLVEALDAFSMGADEEWFAKNYKDDCGRARLIEDMEALADHLKGCTLRYATDDGMREFKGICGTAPFINPGDEGFGTAVCIIQPHPSKPKRYVFSNGECSGPIDFSNNISENDIPSFLSAGPVHVAGKIVRGEDGGIAAIRKVMGVYGFPSASISKIITKDCYIPLRGKISAVPSYDPAKKTWSLACGELGVSVEKPGWDACAMAFHEYLEFIWDLYSDPDKEYEGEEKDIHDFIASLTPESD